jgi:hypothetical protein
VRRSNPLRRRLLMVAIVVVAGVLVYLLSKPESQSGEASLEGRVYLDGQPLGGVRIDFQAENRSARFAGGQGKSQATGISRMTYLSKTDADGRYHVAAMQPGLTYTGLVHRPGHEKEKPLTQADGTLPAVDVRAGVQRFDIQLVDPK